METAFAYVSQNSLCPPYYYHPPCLGVLVIGLCAVLGEWCSQRVNLHHFINIIVQINILVSLFKNVGVMDKIAFHLVGVLGFWEYRLQRDLHEASRKIRSLDRCLVGLSKID